MNVSIVVPCWNRFELTRQCLGSIRAADPVHEIIVVDNGSTDDTHTIATIRHDENQGFAKACNRGALEATGDVVVFLNNDTLVEPGWLRFVGLLDAPTVGAVGPKLVYPSGEIQCAGVQVDLSRHPGLEAWNEQDDWTQVPAPVDAVTGACLGIRRDVFIELDGFDEGFWNGYEDVDLCLRASSCGLVNMYDPTSTVVHLESQSGPDRWTAVRENVFRLRAKWMVHQ
jgi:GT2 family glycosyltransferase